jgi:putative FmdB family regulatory protein
MPTYEYSCSTCAEVFEVFQSMRDAPLTSCPKCGQATVKRLVGRGAGIIFKGSGFYETDYKRSAAKPDAAEKSANGSADKGTTAASSAPASSTGSSPGQTAGAAPTKKDGGG